DIETDHLGTPKALYDHETGREIWSTEHEVYGKTQNNASLKKHPKTGQAVDPKIRFQGQWEDVETGLYQNLHRFYDPHCGRYINHDPIGLMGGLNAYQYCPNPVGWANPLGLASLFDVSTYGHLNGEINLGDNLQAHEMLRHKYRIQQGLAKKPNRLTKNPSITLDLNP
ncbi:MAG: RHS repeat-associated core domain-containing protein, partial [Reinekea sp.]